MESRSNTKGLEPLGAVADRVIARMIGVMDARGNQAAGRLKGPAEIGCGRVAGTGPTAPTHPLTRIKEPSRKIVRTITLRVSGMRCCLPALGREPSPLVESWLSPTPSQVRRLDIANDNRIHTALHGSEGCTVHGVYVRMELAGERPREEWRTPPAFASTGQCRPRSELVSEIPLSQN